MVYRKLPRQLQGMKNLILMCLMVFLSSWIISPIFSEEIKGPQAFVNNPVYTFESTLEGKKITHDYIIQNKGNLVLNIEKVKTG
jgi:hypothetical protein